MKAILIMSAVLVASVVTATVSSYTPPDTTSDFSAVALAACVDHVHELARGRVSDTYVSESARYGRPVMVDYAITGAVGKRRWACTAWGDHNGGHGVAYLK